MWYLLTTTDLNKHFTKHMSYMASYPHSKYKGGTSHKVQFPSKLPSHQRYTDSKFSRFQIFQRTRIPNFQHIEHRFSNIDRFQIFQQAILCFSKVQIPVFKSKTQLVFLITFPLPWDGEVLGCQPSGLLPVPGLKPMMGYLLVLHFCDFYLPTPDSTHTASLLTCPQRVYYLDDFFSLALLPSCTICS